MTRTCSIAAALALRGAVLSGALLSAALLSATHPRVTATAAAQEAAGPVRIYVPFAPGGPTDVVAHILADMLSTRWGGRTVIVENRAGAGTIVATAALAKALPDGTTFMLATNSFLINPALNMKLPYDTAKDFVPISMVATQPVALVASKSFPADTLSGLIAVAKAAPAPLNYTSPGPRGVGHLAGEMLAQRAGINAWGNHSMPGCAPRSPSGRRLRATPTSRRNEQRQTALSLRLGTGPVSRPTRRD
jgi:tripartite-type tricarboxylate transporter receptor subunit TctC